jgi:hypothetical protein
MTSRPPDATLAGASQQAHDISGGDHQAGVSREDPIHIHKLLHAQELLDDFAGRVPVESEQRREGGRTRERYESHCTRPRDKN